ncbi:hypothetical protein Tco_1106089 [Tanacetum coccineum]
MPHHPSKLTGSKVKSIAKLYGISLELHLRVPPEGMTMNKLPKSDIGLYEQFFKFQETGAIPDAMAWRHHDSDVYDPLSDDGYRILDVRTLAEKVIDLRSMHPMLLFTVGLAT